MNIFIVECQDQRGSKIRFESADLAEITDFIMGSLKDIVPLESIKVYEISDISEEFRNSIIEAMKNDRAN